jgi:hypothetical protein
MEKALNLSNFITRDANGNVLIPGNITVKGGVYSPTPSLSENSLRVPTTQWVKSILETYSVSGSVWHVDNDMPEPTLGKNTDMYISTTTGIFYRKEDNLWVAHGQIQGAKGDNGDMGPIGPQGPKGDTGLTGATGATGPTGAKGDKGDVGAASTVQGPQGIQGPKGDKGDKGDRGYTGLTGPIGPQGIQGLPGCNGNDGTPGPAGAVGPVGPRGADGRTFTDQELRNIIFDPEGNYYTEKIRPLVIETLLLEVGAPSQDFQLTDVLFTVATNLTTVNHTAGKIIHMNIGAAVREWTINLGTNSAPIQDQPYFIYIDAPRVGTVAGVLVTQDKLVWNSDPSNYRFLVGVLHSVYNGVRQITLTYGLTTIAGQYIKTGRISSNVGDTYFDLNTGEIHGKITFTSGSSGFENLTDKPDMATYARTNDLGDLAFDDLVEFAKLGTTVIEGGYIKTVLLDTNAIKVSGDFIDATEAEQKKLDAITTSQTYTSTALNAFASIDFVNGIKANLQSQIDGQIVSWFYDYVPTLVNLPASDWTTNTLKDNHLGDLFYHQSTGEGYRFSIVNGVYQWTVLTDTASLAALAKANLALDTADGKRRVFTTTPTTPYDVGDLWAQGSTGDIKVALTARASGPYVAADWDKASKYTDDTAVVTLAASLKAMAYEDKVELAKLGDTVIVGGYIKSSLIDVANVIVNGNIATNSVAQGYATTAEAQAKAYADTKKTEALAAAAIDATTKANAAQNVADAAQLAANAATVLLADFSSDSKLTPLEKKAIKKEWDSIGLEKPTITAQITVYGLQADTKATDFNAAYTALDAYIAPILLDLTTTSTIVGTTFRSRFSAYYDKKALLLKLISDTARTLATNAQAAADAAKGVTDNFTTIDGGLITSNTIKLGTQVTSVAGITGVGTAGTDVRIWAGDTYANRATAPFRVLQNGTLYATGATIGGVINAAAGSSIDYSILSNRPTLGEFAAANKITSSAGFAALFGPGVISTQYLVVDDLLAFNATIGGFTITADKLKTSNGRFELSSAGNITVKDTTGVGTLTIKTGPLSDFTSASNPFSITLPSVTSPSTGGTGGIGDYTYSSSYTTITVGKTGTYSGTFRITSAVNGLLTTNASFTGYAYMALQYVVFDDAACTTIIASGTITSGNVGSASQTLNLSAAGQVNTITFNRTGNFYVKTRWERRLSGNFYSGGAVTYSAIVGSPSVLNNQLSQTVDLAELTDEGFQIVKNSDNFFKIQRSGFDINDANAKFVQLGGGISIKGTLAVTGDITANLASDKRLKENIEVIPNALAKVNMLDGVTYNFTEHALSLNKYLGTDKKAGLIAQQVDEVLPEVIKYAPFDRDDKGESISGENYLTIQYDKVIPLLVEAIKELTKKVEQLENK